MIQPLNGQLHINARELAYQDLDFPECAEALGDYIENNISVEIQTVLLDIRRCVVIYSQASIFLDVCLSKIANSATLSKRLIILTTDNYITRELTCYELFRTTKAVNIAAHTPQLVVTAVDKYCCDHDLTIQVQVFSGDTDNLDTPILASYTFPEELE